MVIESVWMICSGISISQCIRPRLLADPVLAHVTPIEEEGHLGGDRLLRFTQALPAQAAWLAILLRPLEFYHPVAVDRAFAAIAVELLAG